MKSRLSNKLSISVVLLILLIIVAVLIYVGVIDPYNSQTLALSGIYIIVALSLNLISGYTGQLSLGHAGFMSVGAYSTAIAIMQFGIPLLPAVIIGGLVTSVFGILIGIPSLRLKGDYLAITTLGFGEIIRVLMINLDKYTGGAAGLKGIPSFSDTGDFVLDDVIRLVWIFAFVVFTILIIYNLINSSHGRAIVSIREDEIASASMGVNVPYYKVFAFTVSAFLAGIGGGLYAMYIGYLSPPMFGFMNSVNFVVIVVLGGMGSITGTILSGVIFAYIQEWLRILGDFRLAVFGLALIIIMLFRPKGLMGSREISVSALITGFRAGKYSFAALKNFAGKLMNKLNNKSLSKSKSREVE